MINCLKNVDFVEIDETLNLLCLYLRRLQTIFYYCDKFTLTLLY